jgi:hypothetical protein
VQRVDLLLLLLLLQSGTTFCASHASSATTAVAGTAASQRTATAMGALRLCGPAPASLHWRHTSGALLVCACV